MSAPNTSAQFVPTYPDIRRDVDGNVRVGFRNKNQSFDFRDIEHPVYGNVPLLLWDGRMALDCVTAADAAWRDWLKRRQRRGGVSA